jgi:hypothetical protein
MLGKLPKAVDRAVRLEMLSLDLTPDEASSIQTTERYLGSEQDIEIAVNDNLGL